MITVPLILILGAALFFAFRIGYLTGLVGVIAVLFGFMLANTSAAPTINHVIDSLKNIGH